MILLALLQAGCSQSPTPSASTPSPTAAALAPALPPGWKAMTAQDHSFAYAIPANAKSQGENALPGGYQCVYARTGGPAYLVGWGRTAEPLDTPEQRKAALAKFETASLRGGSLVSHKDIEQDGLLGIESQIKSRQGNTNVLARVLAGQGRFYTATILVQGGQLEDVRKNDAPIFFAHFRNLSPKGPETSRVAVEWRHFKSPDGSVTCTIPKQIKERAGSVLSIVPGRVVQVTWGDSKEKFATWKAKFGHNPGITNLHEVKVGSYIGLEFSLDDPQLQCWRTSRLLIGKGRIYTASVGGLKDDPTLQADVRKVLDSLKPTPSR